MAGRYHKSLYIYINFSIAYFGFLRTFDFVPIKCIFSLFRRQGLIQDIIPHNLKYVHKSINVIFDPLHSGLKRTKWGWNGKNDLLNVSYQICMNCWPKTKKVIEKSNIVCNGKPSFLWLWIGVNIKMITLYNNFLENKFFFIWTCISVTTNEQCTYPIFCTIHCAVWELLSHTVFLEGN